MKKKKERTSLIVHVVFILFGICCIVPFMMVVSASLSDELDLSRYGFGKAVMRSVRMHR